MIVSPTASHMADAAAADGVESHIVNTASMAGLTHGGLGAYSASKHGVVALTEKLSQELQAGGAYPAMAAVGETVILLLSPLPSVGVSIVVERGCQQNNSPTDG